jgi:4-cresol dehydrogenase (hydroxylating) cytochrome subunit
MSHLKKVGCGKWITTAVATSVVAGGISTAAAQSDGAWNNGEQVYAKVCGHCHEIGVGPVLKGRELPPDTFTTIARQGLVRMPAFRSSEIDDQALAAVAQYLSTAPAP